MENGTFLEGGKKKEREGEGLIEGLSSKGGY